MEVFNPSNKHFLVLFHASHSKSQLARTAACWRRRLFLHLLPEGCKDWGKNLNSKKSENVCSCWSCDFFSLPSLCNEKSTNLTPPCSNLRRLNLIVKTPWGSKEVSPDRARNGVFGTVPWWNHSLSSPVIPFKMGVSKNRGTPKWMVYNRKPY